MSSFTTLFFPGKIGLLSFLLLTCFATVSAQPCRLKINQLGNAPELLGFRLGMTFDEVKARVPKVRFGRADKHGVSKTSISPNYDPSFDQTGFADVRTISLEFLDGKLSSLWIGYESSFKWPTIDEFVEGIGKSFALPTTWTTKRGARELHCDGITLFVSLIAGGPSFRITDDAAEEIIANRREQEVTAAEVVIGDQSSKLYYPANCGALQIVAAVDRISFKDKEEAEKAGYKLAKACE
jgi:hypothetical protein